MPEQPDLQEFPHQHTFDFRLSRAARSSGANLETANTFLRELITSYSRTETGLEILRMLENHGKTPVKIKVGALAIKAGITEKAPVFDLMKGIKVGGLAILGSIYLPADFFLRVERNRVTSRLLFSHELIHVLYKHDFPRMTLTTEAWAYWHEFKLFNEWQEAGMVTSNMPPMGGAKRGKKIHRALEEEQQSNPSGSFWKPDLVKHLVGSSYDWYEGFGKLRKMVINLISFFSGRS